MFSNILKFLERNAFKPKIGAKYMTEWLYAQKLIEVGEEIGDFKTEAHYKLMQKIIDARDKNDAVAYNEINEFLLELTSKAYGHERTIEEINEDIPLRAGLMAHSSEIIPTEAMNNYRADPTNLANLNGLLNKLGDGLSPERFVINEGSENIVNYLTNSIDYHAEVEGETKELVENIIVSLMNSLITRPDHLAYLAENSEIINQVSDKLETAGLIGLINGNLPEMGARIGIENLEELMEYLD